MKDEIIDEVRHIRDDYFAKHHYDLNVFFEDLKKREAASSRLIEDLAAKRKGQPYTNSASK
jgi:hypothetical protein